MFVLHQHQMGGIGMSSKLPSMMMNELLAPFTSANVALLMIHGVATDSRLVRPGYLFFALQGVTQHGLDFVQDALTRGAIAIVVEQGTALEGMSVPVVEVENLNQKLGHIASRFFGEPSRQLILIGITGTNGKTSCSHLMAQCLEESGQRCGILGTMGVGFVNQLGAVINTTPGAIELQNHLYQLLQQGARCVAMEVSSHGLEQFRTAGCHFALAVFTNLSRDHLDYHGTMEAYGQAKLKLFAHDTLQAAIVNLDDAFSTQVLATIPAGVETIGVSLQVGETTKTHKFICATVTDRSLDGTQVSIESSWGPAQFTTHLLGEFNVSNLLLVLAGALSCGVTLSNAIASIRNLRAPDGRLESFHQPGWPLVVVDYAHTPDALQKVLQTLHAHTTGSLWVLFGCGGDRDSGKRSLMGKVAEQWAQHVWLTNDNPRTEPSEKIIADILSGIKQKQAVTIEPDREVAIREMVSMAAANDIILIAGKGHEDYQIIGHQKLSYSDRETVARILREVA